MDLAGVPGSTDRINISDSDSDSDSYQLLCFGNLPVSHSLKVISEWDIVPVLI